MRWSEGTVYNGEWSAGKMQGEGTLKNKDGDVLQGFFYDNKYAGSDKVMRIKTPKKRVNNNGVQLPKIREVISPKSF